MFERQGYEPLSEFVTTVNADRADDNNDTIKIDNVYYYQRLQRTQTTFRV